MIWTTVKKQSIFINYCWKLDLERAKFQNRFEIEITTKYFYSIQCSGISQLIHETMTNPTFLSGRPWMKTSL